MTYRTYFTRLTSGLTGACAAAAFLPALAQGAPDFQDQAFTTPYWTRVPVIEVLGRADMQVMPNRANFSVTYLETDKESKKAMQLAVERGRLAYETIKKAAGKESVIQSSVNVTALYEQYKDKDGNRIFSHEDVSALGLKNGAATAGSFFLKLWHSPRRYQMKSKLPIFPKSRKQKRPTNPPSMFQKNTGQ